MKKRMDLINSTEEGTESSEAGLLSIAQEMAGNYMKRASLALRPEEDFADTAQELSRYRQAIQILLRGIKGRHSEPLCCECSFLLYACTNYFVLFVQYFR